ncbi:MAG: 1-acyl-sn-glycerol-3-phosphate acyltransferase [Sulfurimonas sp.]|nr:1-acyl-sn-glycerol-3-phosphate acyltransferase [Sulfurimonas sp.]
MKIFARISWLYATTMIFISLGLMILTFKLLPKPYARKSSAWLIKISIFFRVDLKGKEDSKVQMFLLNHESDLDIAIMETITNKNLAWVAKKELFDIPFFGLALKLSQDIAVERESKTSLIKLLKDTKKVIDDNRVVTIFPEGTRSSKGKMLPFKNGAKIVADKYKLIVQPVVLIQTAAYYNIKKLYYKPGKIKVIYLDSFIADESDKDWLNNLRQIMQKVYNNELANNFNHR